MNTTNLAATQVDSTTLTALKRPYQNHFLSQPSSTRSPHATRTKTKYLSRKDVKNNSEKFAEKGSFLEVHANASWRCFSFHMNSKRHFQLIWKGVALSTQIFTRASRKTLLSWCLENSYTNNSTLEWSQCLCTTSLCSPVKQVLASDSLNN